MTDKTSRRNRPKRNRWLLISAIAVFLVLISALAAYSYLNQINKKTVVYDPNTYFDISDLAGTYQTVGTKYNSSDPGPSVFLTDFAFNFTPVLGDVYGTTIFCQGMNSATNTWWVNKISNGTSTFSTEIQLNSPVLISQQNGLYPFPIRMLANNANGQTDVNGTLTLYFNATQPGGNFVYEGPYSAD
jgi:hypothetical protein